MLSYQLDINNHLLLVQLAMITKLSLNVENFEVINVHNLGYHKIMRKIMSEMALWSEYKYEL